MHKKRPSPGRCVHCLKDYELLTWDHVLPESWYPEGADEFVKWQIPACEPCTKRLGEIEENLLVRLGLCLDPKELTSLGIPDKVLRSLNPAFGKNERDRRYRKGKREKIIKEVIVLKELPQQGIFPNFGPFPDIEYKEYPTVMLDPEDVSKFAEKITRGIAYIADKSFIENSYKIELFIIDEQKATELKNMIDSNSTLFDRKPGLLVKRLLVENDKVGGIYFIEIWGRFRMYVTVSPKDWEKRVFSG